MPYRVATVIICALACYGLARSVQLWRVLPYGDQWDAVALYERWASGQWSFSTVLTVQHNEHRLVPTQLVFLADFALFRGRTAFAFAVLLATHMLLGAALGLVATRGMALRERLLGVAAGIAFLLSPLQIENLTLPFHLQWAACPLLALIAFAFLARLPGETSPVSRAACIFLVVMATAASIYSAVNGLAGAAIVIALAIALPIGRGIKIVLVMATAFSIGTFFIGYSFTVDNQALRASLGTSSGLWAFFSTVSVIIGAPMDKLGASASIVLGVMGICTWIVLMIFAMGQRKFDAAIVALLALAAMAVATATAIAFGRAGQGLVAASRYDTWAVIFWATTAGATWRLFADRPGLRSIAFGAGAFILAMSYVTGEGYAGTLRARARLLDSVAAELRSGATPKRLELIYPRPEHILPRIDFLRQNRLSVFAD